MSLPGSIYSLPAAPPLPLVAWLEVEAGVEGGTSGKIAIIHAPALGMDADGNPTPDPNEYGDYPDGSMFYPTAYPAAVDSDAGMIFRKQAGAWKWISGAYRASNNNGSYVRSADGVQRVDIRNFTLVQTTSTLLRYVWDFPVAFRGEPVIVSFTPNTNADYRTDFEPRDLAVAGNIFSRNLVQAGIVLYARAGVTFPPTAQLRSQAANAEGNWK